MQDLAHAKDQSHACQLRFSLAERLLYGRWWPLGRRTTPLRSHWIDSNNNRQSRETL